MNDYGSTYPGTYELAYRAERIRTAPTTVGRVRRPGRVRRAEAALGRALRRRGHEGAGATTTGAEG